MAELDFSDLIPKAASSQGLSFDDLIPSSVPAAIADVPKEASSAFGQSVQHLTGNSVSDLPGYDPRTRGELGPIEGLMRTGRQIAALPEMVASPFVGAARSLIGHPMADLQHKVGEVIAPDIAAKDDPAKMYETAKGDIDTALVAARPVGAPVKMAGSYRIQPPQVPLSKVNPEVPSIQELKDAATAGYQSPEVKGLEIKSSAIRDFAQKTRTALNQAGVDDIVAPKTFQILDRLEKASPGTFVTGDNLNSIRKVFSKAAGPLDKTEQMAASQVIDALDNFVPSLSKRDVRTGDPAAAAAVFDEARANWSAAAQAEKIDKKLVKAEVRAAAANSGINVANTIRQRMADVVLNPAEARGLRPEELATAKQISEGTTGQNLLRTAANYAGKLQGTAIGGVIGSIFGPAGAAVGASIPSAASWIMKATANKMTVTQAHKLSEAIRSRAPLASSAQKFQQAATALQAKRNPKAISGIVLAARNLSTNLKGAGFDISPTDLFKGLQPGNAEDQQGDVQRPP